MKEQTKPKITRRKAVRILRAEINERDYKTKDKEFTFEKLNKIDKSLRPQRKNTQIKSEIKETLQLLTQKHKGV